MTERGAADVAEWLQVGPGGGEMGELIRCFDWSSTPLGTPSGWPVSLRMAVSMCLVSKFPMLVVWGTDLVKIYNDGYRQLLGTEKHPGALGARTRDVWPEIWDEVGPLFAGVMDTGMPTWAEHQMLVIDRNGFPEECFFTFSYSALFDDDGSIGGVLDVTTETTQQIVAQRRLSCLGSLGGALFEAGDVTDVCVQAAEALSGCTPDIAQADIFLTFDDAPVLIASTRHEDVSTVPGDVLSGASAGRSPITLGKQPLVVDGPAEMHLVPLVGAHDSVTGVVAFELSPNRPFDDDYRTFLSAVATTISSALESAFRRSVELGEQRHISDTLQAAMLTPASDVATVAARYRPAARNLAVGGDWYDVIDLGDDRRAVVVGDCVGHGLEAATTMAQLRSAARSLVLEGHDPAATLEGLDVFAASTDGAYCATVVCAIIDRSARRITYARAGHPPPLVVSPHAADWLLDGAGPPLQVGGQPKRSTATRALADDDVVVLCSDGLFERRGEHIDRGLERLAAMSRQLHGSASQHFADELLRTMLPPHGHDDVVLVVDQRG